MENSIVDFIIENIFLFLPLVIFGIVVTIYLYLTGTKEKVEKEYELDADNITIAKFHVNVYLLIYIFFCSMMILIGFLSDFIIPTIVGGALAAIPIIIMILVKFKIKRSKVL